MAVSRLYCSLLFIGVLFAYQGFGENDDARSAGRPASENSDIGEANEKLGNEEPVIEKDSLENDVADQNDEEKNRTTKAREEEGNETMGKSATGSTGGEQDESTNTGEEEEAKPDSYGEGSVCVYCQYCKFCTLCERDCPCKKSKKRPNCHLCKYCKYCYLCTSVCDNFCKPGSFLDTISSAVWSALPKFDNKMKDEVEKDIEAAKNWIKDYL